MSERRKITLCLGSSCFARGNKELVILVKKFIVRKRLEDKVQFRGDYCFGKCSEGPVISIGDTVFESVTEINIEEILQHGLKDLLIEHRAE